MIQEALSIQQQGKSLKEMFGEHPKFYCEQKIQENKKKSVLEYLLQVLEKICALIGIISELLKRKIAINALNRK